MQTDQKTIPHIMRSSVKGQIKALDTLATRINGEFTTSLELLAECRGRIILFGMKQSGLVGQKIAASLYATGLSTHILDPADTWQDNLSMVGSGDIIVMLSYSGKTEELLRLYPSIRQMGNKIIAITGDPKGPVAMQADAVLDASVEENLELEEREQAPTTYTTVLLAIGDALAEALLYRRQSSSPEAQNSDQKMVWVRNLMNTSEIASVSPSSKLSDVMKTMTRYRTNLCLVKDDSRLSGIITDGDLRRNLAGAENISTIRALDIMNPSPISIQEKTSAEEARRIMIENSLHTLIVKNQDQTVVGLLNIDKINSIS
ncbi:hypothetical protein ACH42_05015 [Endozoicomonas sp. (ex Bugula neritina AB1)]|nr:hypothetical protein ACH42_05015 [Endozoicomonas sp. (ex Bugula neritina AB1)]